MNQRIVPFSRALKKFGLLAGLLGAVVACVSAVAAQPTELDPVHTDGDKYHLLLENRFLRVLRYHDEPGAITHPHRHPCFVLYALAGFERELTFPDGNRRSRVFQQGDAAWMPAQTHTGHNIGNTPTEALIVELKGPCS
ncbi:MAG TPA: hypothetical protein VER96_12350 [Polyangiaceae bacterium]|nr:hypothetical protein [Polyangiaceae bacterium]